LEVSLPPGVELYTSLARSVAVSPDGARLAFVGVRGGNREVYVRRLDEFESTPLRGTEAVTGVFFSPNGESVGLVASNGELRTVSLTDNLVTTLTTGVNYLYGATWSNGRIVFVRGAELWHISPTGGTATQLTSLNSGRDETIHAWPFALPGGDAILFAAGSGSRSRIDALMLSTGERRTVVERGTMPLYASSGHLVFSRDGELLAAPFNATTFEVGAPTVRALDRPPANVAGVPVADLSFSGTLVFAPNVSTGRMVWVSRQGAEQPLNDVPRPYGNPRIAPNGSTVLVEAGDLWIQDVTRATFTRLTSNEGALPRFPVLTPDGRRLMYRTAEGLQLRNAEPGEDGQLVAGTSQFDYPGSLGSDGDTLVFMRSSADTSFDIYALSLRDPGKIRPILKTAAYEGGARLSPDSRWLLYISNESGQNEVYVRAFPSPERRWQVSTEGGTQGVWNPNGREIFYRSGDKMMAVDFQAASDVTLSPPRLLFERPYAYGGGITIANYDVTTDGQRFVLIKDEATTGRVNVVLNWSSELGP
jgi:serine/threonine-protein kinase